MADLSSIKTIKVNGVDYFLPREDNDLVTLINDAKKNGKTICVRGSGHSYPMIPFLEKDKKCTYILMSYFDSITIDRNNMTVTVGGGCHLGWNPYDPTGGSCKKNNLFYRLFEEGLAIPEMGGISHQTVGGFLSTGSSGGSLKFSFTEQLESIDIMTAKNFPARETFSKSKSPDFYAAGISLGMFGIIVSATFKCVASFNIKGNEVISTVKNCKIDLFGSGSNDLKSFFKEVDYSRLIWWPQSSVQRMVVWQAEVMEPSDYDLCTGYPEDTHKLPEFTPKPYQEIKEILGTNLTASALTDFIYSAIGYWPRWFLNFFNNSIIAKFFAKVISFLFCPKILYAIIKLFVPIDDPIKGPQRFWDYWYCGLCMDDRMDDKLIPVEFTELWIPLDKTQEVMNELKSFYAESDDNAGSFCCEIYGARKSDFWMSPSYQSDMIRIDVFWFANTDKDPVKTLFQRYWNRFEKYNFRCHWGKYLPMEVGEMPGAEYLESQYPKWKDWMKIRHQCDPHKIFVHPYWKTHLGI